MVKKIRIALIGVICIVMVVLMTVSVVPLFDAEEASIAVGEIYDLSEGWTVEYENGRQAMDVKLPYSFDSKLGDKVILRHDMLEDYASLALNFYADNSALRIFIADKPLYEAGMSSDGINRKQFKASEQEKGMDAFGDDDNAEKTAVDLVTVDLPSNLVDGDELSIVLYEVDTKAGINIHAPYISKRDVAVINVLRESMIPISCALLILILCVVDIFLDVTRYISKERMRGLVIVAIMGLDAVAFIILRTDLCKLFMANMYFFNKIAVMTIVAMPLLLAIFYYIGFNIHFPRFTTFNVWTTIIITFVILSLEASASEAALLLVEPITVCLYLFQLISIAAMLLKWKNMSRGYNLIIYDLISLTFFGTAVVLIMIGSIDDHSLVRRYLIDGAITLSFLFITYQHINIVSNNFKQSVEENAHKLEKQVKIAEAAKAEAIAASEAKGNFLANMSHEIRTPINAVLGMDEMILRESREKSIREYAMDIHTAGQSLLSIINDILDMSKIESGKMEIIPVEYDLSSLINDLANLISFRAKAKNLIFEVDVDSNLPAKVYGDDVRIKQVVTNILTNAVKYTESGNVWLRVSGRADGTDEIIHFEVEDTGIGIKEEDMSKLFEAFQRIEEGRNRNIEGTGLGMSITLQLLSMMDSKLEVDSVYNQGSKFYFDIRQKIVDATPLGDFKNRIKDLESQYIYTRAFIAPDAKLLVVDDNVMNRKVFSALLKPTQIKVVEAESGPEAIELAAKEYFDIIFMDHMMPGMDGIEAFHRIKELIDSPCKDTPIIILTANAVAGAKEAYLEEGFDGFLSKPIVSDKLEEMIRTHLDEGLMQEAPEDIEGSDSDNAKAELENLPAVDGVDWEIAWLHLSSMELIESAFSEFYKIIKIHASKLQEYYDNLETELDNYRIQVHGMKSSAASIGIIPLAGMAKILEFAAKDEKLDIINGMHDIFITEWLSYYDKLKVVFGLGDTLAEPKEQVDTGALQALLNTIKVAMEDMDIDTADESVNKLSGLVIPDAMADLLETLKGQVADLDSDGADETINSMMELLN